MIKPKILWKGVIEQEQLKVTIIKPEQSNRVIDLDLEGKLTAKWQEKLEEAREKGAILYDGQSYRLESFTFQNGFAYLTVSPLKFSIRSTLKTMPQLENLGETYYSHGLSVGGFVITNDGYYVFARKSRKSASSLTKDIIGGVLEKIEPETSVGIFNMNKIELQEEINVKPEMINMMKILGLVRSTSTDIVIVTSTLLNLSAAELKSLFEKRVAKELAVIEFIPSKNLSDYLVQLGGYKPLLGLLL
ncbi:MAG: hypothetical protein WCJ58_01345 [bacterium]